MESLLDFKALVDYKNNKSGKTPLLYAIDSQAENVDVVNSLIMKGKPSVNVDIVANDGWTPLLQAANKKRS